MSRSPEAKSVTLQQVANAMKGKIDWKKLREAGGNLPLDKRGEWRKRQVVNPEALSPEIQRALGLWRAEREATLEESREARASVTEKQSTEAKKADKDSAEEPGKKDPEFGHREALVPVFTLPGGKPVKYTVEERAGKDPIINILAADNCPSTPETKFADYYRTQEGDTFRSIADQYVDAENKAMSPRVVKKAYETTMQRVANNIPYIPENLLFKIPAGYRFVGKDSERTLFQKPATPES